MMLRASSNWSYVGTHQIQARVGSNVVATAPLTPSSHPLTKASRSALTRSGSTIAIP